MGTATKQSGTATNYCLSKRAAAVISGCPRLFEKRGRFYFFTRGTLEKIETSPFFVLLIFSAALLAAPAALQAEAVGSPANILKKGKWVMGLATGTVWDRTLKGGGKARLFQVGHYRGFGLTDWLSVYGKIGAAYLEVDDVTIVKARSHDPVNSFGTNVLTTVQLKTRLFEDLRRDWEWDGSLQYVDIRGGHKGKNEGRWHEYQFATSLAKGLGRLKSYAGVKVDITRFRYKVREDGNLLRHDTYRHADPIGFFAGTDLYFGHAEDVVLNIETGYLNGAQIDVGIAYTF